MVPLASIGVQNIRVICDDTDVVCTAPAFLCSETTYMYPCHGRSVVDIRATAQKHASFITQDVAQWHTYGA